MRIAIEHDNGDEDELFDSIDALLDELELSADREYTDRVMANLNARETHFTVNNGNEVDTFIVQPE
jgi:hypothetical protein